MPNTSIMPHFPKTYLLAIFKPCKVFHVTFYSRMYGALVVLNSQVCPKTELHGMPLNDRVVSVRTSLRKYCDVFKENRFEKKKEEKKMAIKYVIFYRFECTRYNEFKECVFPPSPLDYTLCYYAQKIHISSTRGFDNQYDAVKIKNIYHTKIYRPYESFSR